MKIVNLIIYSLITSLFITVSFADEKKLKFRGNNNSETLKPIEISISPDLLDLEKAKELKNKYKVAKEFAIKTDQGLKKKKKIKFRGNAKTIYKNHANSVLFL